MKCVIALAVLAVALPAAFGAPRPSLLAGTTLLRSADLLDGTVISAPATLAIAPSAISHQSTVITHHSPAIAYAHATPIVHSGLIAASPALLPAGRTTVIAGPSGTITETQGLGALGLHAW